MARRWISAVLLTTLALAVLPASVSRGSGPKAGQPVLQQLSGTASDAPGPAGRSTARNDSFCLTCHGDPALASRSANGRTVSLYVDLRVLRDSAHAQLGCLTCHPEEGATHPERPAAVLPSSADTAVAAVTMCLSCHIAAAAGYAESVHGAPVLAGTGSGATCIDCHSASGSAHATSRLAGLSAASRAESVAENCGRCHADALASYRMTGHSQLVRFGDDPRAATCTNCHGAHAVSAVDDPAGTLAPARLATVCQQCHPGANAQFASSWLGHEASASPSGLADGLHRGIVLLMAVCVGFGLTHTTLDFLHHPRERRGGPR